MYCLLTGSFLILNFQGSKFELQTRFTFSVCHLVFHLGIPKYWFWTLSISFGFITGNSCKSCCQWRVVSKISELKFYISRWDCLSKWTQPDGAPDAKSHSQSESANLQISLRPQKQLKLVPQLHSNINNDYHYLHQYPSMIFHNDPVWKYNHFQFWSRNLLSLNHPKSKINWNFSPNRGFFG